MKIGNEYPTDQAVAVLLCGHTGGGKTTHLLNWPRPWVLDLESNMKGAVEYHRSVNPNLWFAWDSPTTDKDGKPLPENKQFDRCKELIQAAVDDPQVTTVCVDGFGRLCDLLKEKLVWETGIEKPLIIGGRKQMSVSLWGPFGQAVKGLVWDIKGKKPMIVTTHLKVDENELTTVKEEKVDMQGELGKANSYPKCFSDFWQAMVQVCAKDAKHPRGVKYLIRTAPTSRNPSLKTSFVGMPDEFEVGDAAFVDLLKRVAGGGSK